MSFLTPGRSRRRVAAEVASLHDAAAGGHSDVILQIVEGGVDVNAADSDGRTGLHRAAGRGKQGAVYTLLQLNADAHSKDKNAQTVLHWAAFGGCEVTVKALLEAGAVASAEDKHGRTPAHVALAKGLNGILRLLIDDGAPDPGNTWPGPGKKWSLKSFWVSDGEAPVCMCCGETRFTLKQRRHHCRQCGDVVCSKCSKPAKPPWYAPHERSERVCRVCKEVWQSEGTSKGIYSAQNSKGKINIESFVAKLVDYFWFYPSWSRENAVAALTGAKYKIGTWLCRPSSAKDSIALSCVSLVNGKRKLQHFQIKYNDGWFLIDPSTDGRYTVFDTVPALLQYYCKRKDVQAGLFLDRPLVPAHNLPEGANIILSQRPKPDLSPNTSNVVDTAGTLFVPGDHTGRHDDHEEDGSFSPPLLSSPIVADANGAAHLAGSGLETPLATPKPAAALLRPAAALPQPAAALPVCESDGANEEEFDDYASIHSDESTHGVVYRTSQSLKSPDVDALLTSEYRSPAEVRQKKVTDGVAPELPTRQAGSPVPIDSRHVSNVQVESTANLVGGHGSESNDGSVYSNGTRSDISPAFFTPNWTPESLMLPEPVDKITSAPDFPEPVFASTGISEVDAQIRAQLLELTAQQWKEAQAAQQAEQEAAYATSFETVLQLRHSAIQEIREAADSLRAVCDKEFEIAADAVLEAAGDLQEALHPDQSLDDDILKWRQERESRLKEIATRKQVECEDALESASRLFEAATESDNQDKPVSIEPLEAALYRVRECAADLAVPTELVQLMNEKSDTWSTLLEKIADRHRCLAREAVIAQWNEACDATGGDDGECRVDKEVLEMMRAALSAAEQLADPDFVDTAAQWSAVVEQKELDVRVFDERDRVSDILARGAAALEAQDYSTLAAAIEDAKECAPTPELNRSVIQWMNTTAAHQEEHEVNALLQRGLAAVERGLENPENRDELSRCIYIGESLLSHESIATKVKEWGDAIRTAEVRSSGIRTRLNVDQFVFDIDRDGAEKLLMQADLDSGAFLMRKSASFEGQYTLSVRFMDLVKHYRLTANGDQTEFVMRGSNRKFDNLPDLVANYQVNASNDVLCVTLGEPIPVEWLTERVQKVASKCQACGHMPKEGDNFCEACGKPVIFKYVVTAQSTRGLDSWELKRDKIQLRGKLGSGNFGDVRMGSLNDAYVAVKTSKADKMSSRMFLEEAQKMKKLRHKNICRLYGVCSACDPVWLVLEYLGGGCLLEFLHSRRGRSMDIIMQCTYLAQIADAMAYMQDRHWTHGDLAARNILVQSGATCVKVSDFGHAVRCNSADDPVAVSQQLPVRWAALEFYRQRQCNPACDVWSYAVLVFEVLSRGLEPYYEIRDNKVVIAKLGEGWRMPRHKLVPIPFYDMMLACWHVDPRKRPRFSHLHSCIQEWLTTPGLRVVSRGQMVNNKGKAMKFVPGALSGDKLANELPDPPITRPDQQR